MRTIRSAAVTIAALAGLLLAGCGGAGDLVDQVNEEIEEQQAAQAEEDDSDNGDLAAAVAGVNGRNIDTSAHYRGLEYTVGEVTVVDLDADSDMRLRGFELTFDVDVVNPGSDTAQPSPPVTLRWDEAGSDNVVEVNGRGEFRQVPGNSSASGTIVVPLSPQDLEVFDDASARLVLGRSGSSAAEVPVGTAAALIDRFPVPQPGMVGQSIEQGDVTLTITEADIRWNYGNSHVDDGLVLLDVRYTLENNSDGQVCHARGTGNNFSLVTSDGSGYADEGVSDRCVGGGQTLAAATGFVLDADYAGEYAFGWSLRSGFDEYEGEVTVVLDDGPGVPDSER